MCLCKKKRNTCIKNNRYQGESDAFETWDTLYACSFPAMIADWRLNWNLYSDTDANFPFGYVQLRYYQTFFLFFLFLFCH